MTTTISFFVYPIKTYPKRVTTNYAKGCLNNNKHSASGTRCKQIVSTVLLSQGIICGVRMCEWSDYITDALRNTRHISGEATEEKWACIAQAKFEIHGNCLA